MKTIAAQDHSKTDVLMVFVSSHGDEGGCISAGDEDYCLQDLMNLFTSEQCPTLMDKPKLFFIQACRGKT